MMLLAKGRYLARLATDDAEVAAAQALRHRRFLFDRGLAAAPRGRDADGFDAACQHILVEERRSGALVCCCRLMALTGASAGRDSYSAQFYDLAPLARLGGPMLEVGRFCLHPDWHDPDILRLAWAAMTLLVDRDGIRLLLGCSSFPGSDPLPHLPALRFLQRHLAPPDWRPGRKAAEVIGFADLPGGAEGGAAVPPLLRTYLAMGGWVSDHAVIDRQLDTLHVFTAVEIDRIPPARARALRAIAGTAA